MAQSIIECGPYVVISAIMAAAQTTDVKTAPFGKLSTFIPSDMYGSAYIQLEFEVDGCPCLENEKESRHHAEVLCKKNAFWELVASKCVLPQNKKLVPLRRCECGLATVDETKQLRRGLTIDGEPWMRTGRIEGPWTFEELDDVRHATGEVLREQHCICHAKTLIIVSKLTIEIKAAVRGRRRAHIKQAIAALNSPQFTTTGTATIKSAGSAAAKK